MKLKALKLRNEEHVSPAQDLRGLGQEPVFGERFPFCCLTVSNHAPRSSYHRLAEIYGLSLFDSSSTGLVHFILTHRLECEHKAQAVLLFVAGVHLHSTSANISSHLQLIEPMRMHLSNAQNDPQFRPVKFQVEHHLKACNLRSGTLGFEKPIAVFLEQAGFEIRTVDEGGTYHFTSDDMVEFEKSFHTEEANAQSLNLARGS